MTEMHDPADKPVKESTKKTLIAISCITVAFMIGIITLLVMTRAPAQAEQQPATEEEAPPAQAPPQRAPSGGGAAPSAPASGGGGGGGGGHSVAVAVGIGFVGPDIAMRRVLCQRARDEGKPLPPECPQ